jgi:glycosyltransferase involved in cell wall biosynthesis
LFISSFGDMRGGGQYSLLLLLKGLDKGQYKPFVICPQEGALVDEVRSLGITVFVFEFPSFKKLDPKKIFTAISKFKKLIQMINPDVVHTESSRSIVYLKCALWRRSIPIIWHARVSNAEPFLYEWILYSCATRVIAISEAVKRRFRYFLGAKRKIEVIYNAVEIPYREAINANVSLKDEVGFQNSVLVGIVGRVTPLKGQETFIKAAALVAEKNSTVRFVIIGEGTEEYLHYLRGLIKNYNLDNKIYITGYRENAAHLIKDLDILVCASIEEAFSRVSIEAMAHGRPVVATNVGGIPEVVVDGETGILVPVQDENAMAQAILEFVNDCELRERMGENGRKRVAQCFAVDQHLQRVQDIYTCLG